MMITTAIVVAGTFSSMQTTDNELELLSYMIAAFAQFPLQIPNDEVGLRCTDGGG